METQHGIVTLAKFNGLLDTLISKIQADETFSPDTILLGGNCRLAPPAARMPYTDWHDRRTETGMQHCTFAR